ncbi:MAG: hypothetical protein V5A23_03490 [Halobacteriales archaeon]
MLLVVTYSRAARQALRNVSDAHEETVVRRFGRAALVEGTEFGAFLATWLLAEHAPDVQVERAVPFVPGRDVPDRVRTAAAAYADRDHVSTPYAKFAANREHPSPATMKARDL